MQIGTESYGLKHVELLTAYQRSHDIDAGSGAVVDYDHWCRDADPARLERIARYNADDVEATKALRDWLIDRRPADLPWRPAVLAVAEPADIELDAQVEALLAIEPPTPPTGDDAAEAAPPCPEHLLAHLLGYWRRETHAEFGELAIRQPSTNVPHRSTTRASSPASSIATPSSEPRPTASLPRCPLRWCSASRPRPSMPRLVATGRASTVFGRPDGLLGFADIDGIDVDPDAGTGRETRGGSCR